MLLCCFSLKLFRVMEDDMEDDIRSLVALKKHHDTARREEERRAAVLLANKKREEWRAEVDSFKVEIWRRLKAELQKESTVWVDPRFLFNLNKDVESSAMFVTACAALLSKRELEGTALFTAWKELRESLSKSGYIVEDVVSPIAWKVSFPE